MPNAGDILFGESPSANFFTGSTISPERQKQIRDLLDLLNNNAPAAGSYGAGLSNLEQTSLSGLEAQALDIVGQIKSTGSALPSDFDSFFKAEVEDPTIRTFNEDILPGIGRQFAGKSFGSERAELEGRAARETTKTLADERTTRAFAERKRSEDLLQTLFQLGSVPREVEDQQIVRQNTDALNRAQIAAGLLSGSDVENIGIANPGSPGILPGIVGDVVGGVAGDVLGPVVEGVGDKIADTIFGAGAGAAGAAGGKVVGGGVGGWLAGTAPVSVGAIPSSAILSGPGTSGAAATLGNPFLEGAVGADSVAGGAGADVFAGGSASGAGGGTGGAALSTGAALALNVLPTAALAFYGLSNAAKKEAQFKPEIFAERQVKAVNRVKKNIESGGDPLAGLNLSPHYEVNDNEESEDFGMRTGRVAGVMIEGNDPAYFFNTMRQAGAPPETIQLVWDRISKEFGFPSTPAPSNAVRSDLSSLTKQKLKLSAAPKTQVPSTKASSKPKDGTGGATPKQKKPPKKKGK